MLLTSKRYSTSAKWLRHNLDNVITCYNPLLPPTLLLQKKSHDQHHWVLVPSPRIPSKPVVVRFGLSSWQTRYFIWSWSSLLFFSLLNIYFVCHSPISILLYASKLITFFSHWTSEGFAYHCPINRPHVRQADVSSFCHFVSFFFFFIYLFITSMWACMFVWEEFMIKKRYSSMERRGDKTDDLVERSFHGVYGDSCSTTTNPQFLVCLLLSLLFFMFFYYSASFFSLLCILLISFQSKLPVRTTRVTTSLGYDCCVGLWIFVCSLFIIFLIIIFVLLHSS